MFALYCFTVLSGLICFIVVVVFVCFLFPPASRQSIGALGQCQSASFILDSRIQNPHYVVTKECAAFFIVYYVMCFLSHKLISMSSISLISICVLLNKAA